MRCQQDVVVLRPHPITIFKRRSINPAPLAGAVVGGRRCLAGASRPNRGVRTRVFQPYSSPLFTRDKEVSVTAKDISDLRKATGAGIMDCKAALAESGGDIDGAMDYLRKKGQKVAAKRADRETTEGVVVAIV